MKKNFYVGLIALTALTVTSCSNDDVVMQSLEVNKAIEFGTYVGRDAVSRGHVTSIEKLAVEGFGVFAYYTVDKEFDAASNPIPNFMYNQQVTSTSGTATEKDASNYVGWTKDWTYSPVKYWPNNVDEKVSFFAYAPYSEGGGATNFTLPTSDTQGAPSLTFKVDTDVEKHQDLLWTVPVKDKSKNSTSPIDIDTKVAFAFQHALSRIGFQAEVMVDKVNGNATGADDDDNVTVSGNLDQFTTITINKVQLIGKFYVSGTMSLTDGTWSSQAYSAENEGVVTYELNSDATTDFAEREDKPNANIFKKDDYSQRLLNNTENYIMIIPQNMTETGTNAPGKVQIYVEYDVFTDINGDGDVDENDSKITNKITSDEFEINFEQGKAYSLNLHLGMTSVKFSATVKEWEVQTGTAVNVPINTGTNPVVNP